MPKEIERKWLLKDVPFSMFLEARNEQLIKQFYLPNNLRIRIIDNVGTPDSIKTAKITYKEGTGLVRTEEEEDITLWIANKLAELAEFEPITKRRHKYRFEEMIIDFFFHNLQELTIAEKEFKSEHEARRYSLPYVIEELVIREVTNDPRYSNYSLARAQEIPTEI